MRGSASRRVPTIYLDRGGMVGTALRAFAHPTKRLTRRTCILDDRAEQLPALAVELHHLHLLVDAVVVQPGVDLHAGQRQARGIALDAGDLLHDVLAREVVAALLEPLRQQLG